MSTQRYKNPTARERMSKGQCPECGTEVEDHGGWGGPGCTLTDNGVAQRINQYRQDMDPANLEITDDGRTVIAALSEMR